MNVFSELGLSVVKEDITKKRGYGVSGKTANGVYNEVAAIIVESRPESAEKKAFRFVVNRKAAEMLNLACDGNDTLAIAELQGKVLGIANVTNNEAAASNGYKVGKNSAFSNRKLHQSVIATFGLSAEVDNILVLTKLAENVASAAPADSANLVSKAEVTVREIEEIAEQEPSSEMAEVPGFEE